MGDTDRTDWKAWIQVVLAVVLPLVAVVAWATMSLSGKASAADMTAAQLEMAGLRSEQRASTARIETDIGWMKAAIWALVQRTGATAAPPPQP